MVRGDQQRERVRRFQVCYIYEDSITKSTKYCLTKRGGEGDGNTMEGEVDLFKVHCMHVWNYHNEIPSYY
jgi:hypothetical protein